MGASAYIVTNRLNGNVGIAVSSEDPTYPRGSLYDREMAKVFRWTSTAGWVELDFGSAVVIDTLAIHNHEAESGATITVKTGDSTAALSAVSTPSWQSGSIWSDLGSVSAQFLRLEISGLTSGGIGQLVPGVRTALPRAHRYGKRPGRGRRVINHETERGMRYNYHLFKREVRDYTWRVNESELAAFDLLDRLTQGEIYPLTFIPDVDDPETLYCRKLGEYRPQELADPTSAPIYDVTLSLSEESRGEDLQ